MPEKLRPCATRLHECLSLTFAGEHLWAMRHSKVGKWANRFTLSYIEVSSGLMSHVATPSRIHMLPEVFPGDGHLWVRAEQIPGGEPLLLSVRTDSGTAEQVIRLPLKGTQIAVDATSAWIADRAQTDPSRSSPGPATLRNSLHRIDLQTGIETAEVEVSGNPVALALGNGVVWVACAGNPGGGQFSLDVFDIGTGEVIGTTILDGNPAQLLLSYDALWIVSSGPARKDPPEPESSTLTRVDIGTRRGEQVYVSADRWIRLLDAGPSIVVIERERSREILTPATKTLSLLDPATGHRQSIPDLPFEYPGCIAAHGTTLWFTNAAETGRWKRGSELATLDLRSGECRTVPLHVLLAPI